jgi:5-methylcytosine-specific restriction endonuclease McrA
MTVSRSDLLDAILPGLEALFTPPLAKSRAEAKALGKAQYFTGKPCIRGHYAMRVVKGNCTRCMRDDWALDNEKRKGKPKSDAAKAAAKRYYEKNREAVIARASARPKEQKQAYRNVHKKNNLEIYKALTSVRKRRHRSATPKWITPDQKLAMRGLYLKAQELTKLTGQRYVVDHIVPLLNPDVCGLHVPWNLQIMTQEENLKKSNLILDTQTKQA